MNSAMLFNELEEGRFKRAYLFHGEEEFAKEEALAKIVSTLDPAMRDFNLSNLEAPQPGDIIAACETLPFMDARRVVVARGCAFLRKKGDAEDTEEDKADGAAGELAAYIAKMPESACLVMFERGKLDGRKAAFRAISKVACAVEFAPLRDWEAADWVRRRLDQRRLSVTGANARRIVELCGTDLMMLDNEITKLAAVCEGEVSRKEIDRYVSASLEHTVFDMMDMLEAGKLAEGFAMLRNLTTGGAAPQILAAIAWRIRMLLMARELADAGVKKAEAVSRMGGGYAAQKAVEACGKFTVERLKWASRALANADYGYKSGQLRDGYALERTLAGIYAGAEGSIIGE